MTETQLIIREILVTDFHCDPERIDAETRLRQDLRLDEVEILELVAAVEEETCVAIDNDAAGGFQTVRDISEYIDQVKA